MPDMTLDTGRTIAVTFSDDGEIILGLVTKAANPSDSTVSTIALNAEQACIIAEWLNASATAVERVGRGS